MEHFRSSGTSGGLLFSRTASAFLKEHANQFLRSVGIADHYAIRHGKLRQSDVDSLKSAVASLVSESWLARNADAEAAEALRGVDESTPPDAADRIFSAVLRARFPEETVRPELNSRWG